jgi:hypothetical protein
MSPLATAKAKKAPTAERMDGPWLVMLYLAGDTNLTEDMVLALQDLIEVGVPGKDRVVAQLDPIGVGLSTTRYDLTPKAKKPPKYGGRPKRDGFALQTALQRFEVEDVVEQSTGSAENLSSFIEWAVGYDTDERTKNNESTDSTKYLLILSGHGSGVTEDFFLRDETSMDSLKIPELQQALRAAKTSFGKKLDILGLDACYMAMGEVQYQLRNDVSIVIGAEGLEPEFGWPYGRILKGARAAGGCLAPEALAKLIVDTYVKTYSDFDKTAGRSVDLGAVRLAPMKKLAVAVKRLSAALHNLGKSGHERVLLAHWYSQTYKFDQYVDLRDFCRQLKTRPHRTSELTRPAMLS